jgi:hypothetical protein
MRRGIVDLRDLPRRKPASPRAHSPCELSRPHPLLIGYLQEAFGSECSDAR